MAGPLLSPRGRGNNNSFYRPPMAEINVTPFVDVMLVLLVVFMVTAPLITQGVQVSLPEVQNAAINEQKEPIQVTIKAGGEIYVQSQKVAEGKLVRKLEAIRQVRPGASILLRSDKVVPYGRVMEVMGALQAAGLVDVGLVTQPPGAGN